MAADPTNELNPPPTAGSIPDPNASQREQILGVGAGPDTTRQNIPERWHRFYDLLVKQRDELIDASTDLTSKAREVSPDPIQDEPAEIGTSNFQRDQLLGNVTYDQEILSEINEAISRMESGTYGICQATGKPIPEARLEAVPWARLTAEAQAELEARGEASTQAIGPLGDMHERGTASASPRREKEGSI